MCRAPNEEQAIQLLRASFETGKVQWSAQCNDGPDGTDAASRGRALVGRGGSEGGVDEGEAEADEGEADDDGESTKEGAKVGGWVAPPLFRAGD